MQVRRRLGAGGDLTLEGPAVAVGERERDAVEAPAAPPVTLGGALRPGGWSTTFTSLRERDYAWYFAGNVAFFMGMQMQFVLRGYLAFDLTGRASALGVVAVFIALPMLIAAPFGGVVADRVNKAHLLIATQATAAATAAVMAALVLTGLIAFWHIVVSSLVTGLVLSFNMPARQAMVPQLVPQHKLMNAISLQMGGMNFTRIVAPAVGGVLIAPIGVGGVYVVVASLFVLAMTSELKLPKHGLQARREQASSFREDFLGGFSYIAQRPMLRLLIGASLLLPLFGFPVQQMLPVFAEDVFNAGPAGLGILFAATGVGGLAGAIITANMDARPQKGRLMLGGGVLMGTFLVAFALSSSLPLAIACLVAANVGQMLFMATNNSVIQASVPAEYRGRVMSVMMMSFGLMPLGVIPITLASDQFGPAVTVATSSALLIAAVLALALFAPRLRRLRITALAHGNVSPAQAAALVAAGELSQEEADRMAGGTIDLDD